jgi:PKD repeat protein
VTDDHGAVATATRSVAVVANVVPTASFTASCSGRTCTVDATASTDTDGTIASYRWAWGDSTTNTVTTKTTSHTYSTSGPRTIVLTVTDSDGATAAATGDVNPNLAPVASFTVDTCNLALCAVTAAASTDSDGTIASYVWSWGDGSPNATGVNGNHTYTTVAQRIITLTVTDDDGAVTTTTKTVNPPVLVIGSKASSPSYSVTLTWNAASLTANTKVDVYRNGALLSSSLTNSGTFTRSNSSKSQVEGTYKVCDHAAPTRCTNNVVVSFP